MLFISYLFRRYIKKYSKSKLNNFQNNIKTFDKKIQQNYSFIQDLGGGKHWNLSNIVFQISGTYTTSGDVASIYTVSSFAARTYAPKRTYALQTTLKDLSNVVFFLVVGK